MAGAELQHVLDGYKVLDFTQVLAGPTVTRLMAEMGAEIIKVELAPTGDLSRALPFLKDGRSAYFIQQNRGKKSLCIDVRNPKGNVSVHYGLAPPMGPSVPGAGKAGTGRGPTLRGQCQASRKHGAGSQSD